MTDGAILAPKMPPETAMRQALADRDARYDGVFV
jgi:hypothetical protein